MSDFTESIAETVGYDNFEVTIEDGKMLINPSDAGIAIFAHVSMAEGEFAKYEEQAETLTELVAELREDNAFLRDLLEETVETIGGTFPELANRLIFVAYPVKGIKEDSEVLSGE
jgi:hypothetical protein